MNSKYSNLNIAALSDVHLGHSRTPTSHIVGNLNTAFPDNLETKNLDIIFIAGDLFDQSLHFSDDDVTHIQRWITKLLVICEKYDIILRILEGTSLHDRKQSSNIVAINDSLDKRANVKHVSKLSIERIDKHDITVLYVPDEWSPDPNHTWKDVKTCLSKNGLKSVDFAIMHGMFEYQVPPGCPIEAHKESRYESIVDKFIFIGHIHQSSQRRKICAPGSFDRLSHGDEGKKGYWKISIDMVHNSNEITFIENKNPFIYHTINCVGLSFNTAIETITGSVPHTNGSFCRLLLRRTDATHAVAEWAKKNFPTLRWSVKIIDNDERKNISNPITKYSTVSITIENIEDQVKNKLDSMGVSEKIKTLAIAKLKELK